MNTPKELRASDLTPEAQARFWSKVDKTGECWVWTASKLPTGYGMFGLNGVNVRAHRASYALRHDTCPADFNVLHRCDNPSCVNPDHLSLGTQAENVADMVAKGRVPHKSINVGVKNPSAKITQELADRIRADSRTQYVIAESFGISQSMVSLIKLGRNWVSV